TNVREPEIGCPAKQLEVPLAVSRGSPRNFGTLPLTVPTTSLCGLPRASARVGPGWPFVHKLFADGGGRAMKFRPLHDRVVVRRIDAEEKTAGGIIIPDTAKEKPQQGEVLAVGPGKRDETGKLIALDVKAGD